MFHPDGFLFVSAYKISLATSDSYQTLIITSTEHFLLCIISSGRAFVELPTVANTKIFMLHY